MNKDDNTKKKMREILKELVTMLGAIYDREKPIEEALAQLEALIPRESDITEFRVCPLVPDGYMVGLSKNDALKVCDICKPLKEVSVEEILTIVKDLVNFGDKPKEVAERIHARIYGKEDK